MLTSLYIKNVALIEELYIDFQQGLNILSGETGAGKSMVIGSLQFILGGRPNKDFIRNGADMAQVEGALFVESQANRDTILAMGIELDEDNTLLLYRSQHLSGKNVCRINGRTVTLGMMKEVAALLFDLHGQHEHQSLLNPSRHMALLDRFCPQEMGDSKELLESLLKTYREIMKKISDLSGDESQREQWMDMYSFQVEEIELAGLKADEEEILSARRKMLSNAEMIAEKTETALRLLREGEGAALDNLARGKDALESLVKYDEQAAQFMDRLESAYIELDDLTRDLHRYKEGIEHDPDELYRIESRLDLIYRLKRKYGKTVADILSYAKETKEKLETLRNSEELLSELLAEQKKTQEEIRSICEKISQMRRLQSTVLGSRIENALRELGMEHARFTILVEQREEFGPEGYDKVEFYISPNQGEEIKPMAKVASGGEISRVMLALKTVLADADTIENFIFDEIDTGVSGRTAQKVAERLNQLGRCHQILCITHLPQIAAMADGHFLIEKKSQEGKTYTTMQAIWDEMSIAELARLIGGAQITETTMVAAREMKHFADILKNKERV